VMKNRSVALSANVRMATRAIFMGISRQPGTADRTGTAGRSPRISGREARSRGDGTLRCSDRPPALASSMPLSTLPGRLRHRPHTTPHPAAHLVADDIALRQRAIEAFPVETTPRFLIHDRDPPFISGECQRWIGHLGSEVPSRRRDHRGTTVTPNA
jgi:hypothetical protein